MEADAIDSSKENIQPLRSGRKTQALGVALQAQSDADLQHKLFLKREEYELCIRMYEGPDPLKPRYNYVLWLEQNFPKNGRESNLVPLLEDTISLFKNDKKYIQDTRFVSLITKFIETQVNPLELFQVVFNQGIGTMCAILYKAWAEELDLCGDIKRADQVYQMGIKNRAEPTELLLQEHQQFQLSVGRRLLNGGIEEESETPADVCSRSVLGKISRKKTGSVRPALGKAGTVPLCLSNCMAKTNTPVHVYQESEADKLFGQGSKAAHFPKSESSHKENTMKPGTWNKKYSSGSQKYVSYTPVTPKFKVHEDPDDMTAATPRHISEVPNALKTRKADVFHCPMAIFEPPSPTVQPMYCKHLVYTGGREFQLEEIRAAIYNKKHNKTCLTPMVLDMLKGGIPEPPKLVADKGNLRKCVSQLKFTSDEATSSTEEKPLSGLQDVQAESKFNVYCDEEQICSMLSPTEPNCIDAEVQSGQTPTLFEEKNALTNSRKPETSMFRSTPVTLVNTIFKEDKELSSHGPSKIQNLVTKKTVINKSDASSSKSSLLDPSTSNCATLCSTSSGTCNISSGVSSWTPSDGTLTANNNINLKSASSNTVKACQEDKSNSSCTVKTHSAANASEGISSNASQKPGSQILTKTETGGVCSRNENAKSHKSTTSRKSKLNFTIYCGDD